MTSRKKKVSISVAVVGALAAVITIPSLVSHTSGSGSSEGAAATGSSGQVEAGLPAGPTGQIGSSTTVPSTPSTIPSNGAAAPMPAPLGSTGAASGGTSAQQDSVPILAPHIIRTGSIYLRVPSNRLTSVYNVAANDAASVGGYVESSSTAGTSTGAPSATLRLRIPSGSFTKVVGEIAGLGKVLSESTQGADVTGAIVNIDARIANLEAEQNSLRALIKQAGTIPQILTVENQLFGVEGQIEQLSGQQSALADQVSFATLSVDLSARPAPAKKPAPKPVVNAFTQGAKLALHNTAASLHGISLAVGAAFPVLLLAALVLGGMLLYRRRKRSTVPAPTKP